MAGKSHDDKTIWHTYEATNEVRVLEMSEEDLISFMLTKNSKKYNKLKAAEELMELALALQQQVLKENRVPDQMIIDEIGDVKIRLKILEQMYSSEDITTRYKKKIAQFIGYINSGKFGTKYKNI